MFIFWGKPVNYEEIYVFLCYKNLNKFTYE